MRPSTSYSRRNVRHVSIHPSTSEHRGKSQAFDRIDPHGSPPGRQDVDDGARFKELSIAYQVLHGGCLTEERAAERALVEIWWKRPTICFCPGRSSRILPGRCGSPRPKRRTGCGVIDHARFQMAHDLNLAGPGGFDRSRGWLNTGEVPNTGRQALCELLD